MRHDCFACIEVLNLGKNYNYNIPQNFTGHFFFRSPTPGSFVFSFLPEFRKIFFAETKSPNFRVSTHFRHRLFPTFSFHFISSLTVTKSSTQQ